MSIVFQDGAKAALIFSNFLTKRSNFFFFLIN